MWNGPVDSACSCRYECPSLTSSRADRIALFMLRLAPVACWGILCKGDLSVVDLIYPDHKEFHAVPFGKILKKAGKEKQIHRLLNGLLKRK